MYFLFLKSLSDSIISGFKSIISFIVKYPKQAIAILLCAFALYGGLKVKESFDDLKQQNTTLTSKLDTANKLNGQLKLDVATVVSVNKENQETIKHLSVAAVDSKKQIEELKKVKEVIHTKVITIRETIAQTKPEDDGPIAKVLKDTIATIQKDREQAE